jgi:predicted amidohydrolase
MIVSLIQFAPVLGGLEQNRALISEFLDEAKDADLAVLPELAFTGYNFSDPEMARTLSEVPAESASLELLHKKAIQNDQHIICGFNERAGDVLFNSTALVGPDGLLGIYRKMHLFMKEKNIFEPGNSNLDVFDIGCCKLGMQICFDYLFPEPWRILAQRGAELIIHPSNLLTQNATKSLPGIALRNKVFTLTANRIGTEGDLTFNGNSMIIDPAGDIILRASADNTEIISMTIDASLAHNKMITEMNHVFDDRRPEQYS